ncbi:MAG: hypothetical protein RR448_08525 [Niameybacter sp.]
MEEKHLRYLKLFILGIGIIALTYFLILYVAEIKYRRTIEGQLEQLMALTLEQTVVELNGEEYVFQYTGSEFLNDFPFPFRKDRESVAISFAMFKGERAPENALGTTSYLTYVRRDSIYSPIEWMEEKRGNYFTDFITAVCNHWYNLQLEKLGNILQTSMGISYKHEFHEPDTLGKVVPTGCIRGSGDLEAVLHLWENGQEQHYNHTWQAEFQMPEIGKGTIVNMTISGGF